MGFFISSVSLFQIPHPTQDVGDMMVKQAKTLQALDRARGVPKLIGLTEKEPVALVMEFIQGMSLGRYLRTCRSLEQALEVLQKVREAITSFHNAGFVHHDLHFGNILTDKSDNDTVHIIDVGQAEKLPWLMRRQRLRLQEWTKFEARVAQELYVIIRRQQVRNKGQKNKNKNNENPSTTSVSSSTTNTSTTSVSRSTTKKSNKTNTK